MRRSDMADHLGLTIESVSRALSALQLARAATHWEKWDYARSLWTFKRELPDVAAILAALHDISELVWLKSLDVSFLPLLPEKLASPRAWICTITTPDRCSSRHEAADLSRLLLARANSIAGSALSDQPWRQR